MKKWILLEQSSLKDSSVIALYERDGTYSIRINGQELMSTRKFQSEEALASISCESFARKKNVKVLIGGLGFGFTLKAALKILPLTARVVVSEIFPAVVSWNRNENYNLSREALLDERVEVIEKDVAKVIVGNPSTFDVILLDVDNGPYGLSLAANEKLYHEKGLYKIKTSLKSGGCLGVWSAQENPIFAKLLKQVGFTVEVKRVLAHQNSGLQHVIFLAWLINKSAKRKTR